VEPRDVLERYFQALRDNDWASLRECVSENVHRTGPYLDVVQGRDAYAEFLAGVVPTLENYELRVHDVTLTETGSAWVRLSETLDVRGVSTEHPEALYFEFDDAGLIGRVDIYLKRPAL
jgi:hypothetical protein